jgi:hypothetical protein
MRPPTGPVARVEPQWSHREFVETVSPETVMLSLNSANTLCKRGETASSYFGDRTVITTTTMADRQLTLTTWESEFETVQAFEPDFHIPTDVSDYATLSGEERAERILECMDGTLWMANRFADAGLDTEIIPLIKGKTTPERRICYRAFDRLDAEMCAFYAVRYFTGGDGNQIAALYEHTEEIAEEYPIEQLLIGCLKPRYLANCADAVTAAAGQNQWRQQVKPRKQSAGAMRATYADLATRVRDALDVDESPATVEREVAPGATASGSSPNPDTTAVTRDPAASEVSD